MPPAPLPPIGSYPGAYAVAPASPAARLRDFGLHESVAALCCLVLGVLWVRLIVWHPAGRGLEATLLLLAFLALGWVFLRKSGYAVHTHARWVAAVYAVFALCPVLTDNAVIKTLVIWFELLAGTYFVFAVCEERESIDNYFGFGVLDAALIRPFSGFPLCFRAAGSLNKNMGRKWARQIGIGILMAVPLTIFVGFLLAQADLRMQELLDSLIPRWDFALIPQILIGLLFACYSFGALCANAHHFYEEKCTGAQYASNLSSMRICPNLVIYTALVPVLLLYAVFFVLQADYFLSAFRGVLPEGWGYADYARRGFFELCGLSVIDLLLIWGASRFSLRSGDEATRPLRLFVGLLSASTLLMIAVALSKMVLYIGSFGLTRLRLYTSWFMVLLAVVFLLILVKQFARGVCFFRAATAAFVALFAVLCFSMSDNLIARYNIAMFERGRHAELDVDYLLRDLSDDAALYTLRYLDGRHRTDGLILNVDLDAYLDSKISICKWHPEDCRNLSTWRVVAEARVRRPES